MSSIGSVPIQAYLFAKFAQSPSLIERHRFTSVSLVVPSRFGVDDYEAISVKGLEHYQQSHRFYLEPAYLNVHKPTNHFKPLYHLLV
jgi:hypothetical protein